MLELFGLYWLIFFWLSILEERLRIWRLFIPSFSVLRVWEGQLSNLPFLPQYD